MSVLPAASAPSQTASTLKAGAVCEIYASNVYPGLATVIRALVDGGYQVRLAAPKETVHPATDHNVTFPLLEQSDEIEIIPLAENNDPPPDVLLVAWAPHLPYTPGHLAALRRRAMQASKTILLFDAYFGQWNDICVHQVRWFRQEWTWIKRLDSVCYVTVVPGFDLFSLFKPRKRLSVGPNAHYLLNPDERALLYAEDWRPGDKRPFRLICTGAKNTGKWRIALINHLEAFLKNQPGIRMAPEAPADLRAVVEPSILWSFEGRRPPLAEYLQLSSHSDFVLCIPGTSWTHRPFESLVRGAIPIVDTTNARMHDIPWVDGENCVLVPDLWSISAWEDTVRRALDLPQEQLAAMRQNIARLRDEYLDMAAFSRRLRQKLGL